MTDLPALDDLMAKFRERMLAGAKDAPDYAESAQALDDAIDAKVQEVRDAIVSRHDTIAQLTRKPEPLASPKGLRRLFPGLR